MKPATRLLTLISLLQRQPNQKAAGLARELGVTVRTLHRYFGELEEMGVPVFAERGRYGGFSLVRGYKMPPLALGLDEAVAVTLGTSLVPEIWGELYREAATSALAKLDQVIPEEQRAEASRARRTLMAMSLHASNVEEQAPKISLLRSALRDLRQVEMGYTSQSGAKVERRRLDPYVLVLRWGWWYVAGYCHRRNEVRTFRVDRMSDLTLMDEGYQIPTGFDGRVYFEREMPVETQIRATLRFSPALASVALANRAGWEDLQELPDGAVIVTTVGPEVELLARNVLMYGPLVEVLEPAELRILLADWAKALVDLYPSRGSR